MAEPQSRDRWTIVYAFLAIVGFVGLAFVLWLSLR